MPNTANWLNKIIALPEVVKRFGHIKFAAKAIKPTLAAAVKEEKKAAPAKEAKKPTDDGDDEEKP
jgi:hypothetical protein